MISSMAATLIIIGFLIIFGVVLPIIEHYTALGKAISLRWAVMVTLLAVMLGCILDFGHLEENTRYMAICGTVILSAIFIIIRSFEKWMCNGWKLGVNRIHLEKGDIKGDITLHGEQK